MARQLLNLPVAAKTRFQRNFLRQTVCELRFPTLYALESPRPPPQLAQALRADYPRYGQMQGMDWGPGGAVKHLAHSFRSRGEEWGITVRTSAVVLETTQYTCYEDFRERLAKLLPLVQGLIESTFFTRVGLRYINVVPFPPGQVSEWINPGLSQPLQTGLMGDLAEYSGRIAGFTDVGRYLLQHGVALDGADRTLNEYSLDIDVSAENIDATDVLQTVDKLHTHEFSLFSWAIGPAALAHLSAA